MLRWFFIIPSVLVFMGMLAFFFPSVVFTPAFQVGGFPLYWGFLETGLMLYIGHRSTK